MLGAGGGGHGEGAELGVYAMAARDLFAALGPGAEVRASFFELYVEEKKTKKKE